ncbi:C40 family peptidase [Cohnella sp. JJ-181]|uniref:C40 family peptidase n=1 Tax=Cohnella rhizoplanae TaxID=2974897 RepID=UPI0022FF5A46|nr:C40 family peptidase [Cohnella sp. JJ-181]CAI6085101.1 Murein DD-endopeptidase MepS/Murein LD-carboxypeptidase [Cohnella sp. JJ-181]
MATTNTLKKLMASAVALTVLFGGAAAALPAKTASAAEATVTASSKASSIVALGKRYLGVRYKFGAKTGNTSSFDCSSFTQYLFRKYGVSLPRESKAQSKAGRYVSKSNLKPGDLVFFYSPIHHVGIYIGGGKVIHTYGKPGVTISSINSGWWKNHYTTARRVL